MKDVDVLAIRNRIETVLPTLNEYQSRRYLSVEAKALGYGGISLVSRLSGMSRQTLMEGVKETWQRRQHYARRQKRRRAQADLGKTTEYRACHCVVGEMLNILGYGLQGDKKTLTVTESHVDRDVQFEYINEWCQEANALIIPVISIDAKKKEPIGNFKNKGTTYQPHSNPIQVLDHDFPFKEMGKVTPFGVYNIFKNQSFVSVGVSRDTTVFAVPSIRKWWRVQGVKTYGTADEIVITTDCGGNNGYKNRLWKHELQKFSNKAGKKTTVLHYPPGTSKWNKIKHRLFALIPRNRQGIPLTNYE